MSNDNLKILNEEFQRDCKVINMKYEYEGYSGEVQWAIISALTEEEIHKNILRLSRGMSHSFYCRQNRAKRFMSLGGMKISSANAAEITRTHLDMTMSLPEHFIQKLLFLILWSRRRWNNTKNSVTS